MVGTLESARVTVAIAMGIPLAVGLVVAVGVSRRTPAPVVWAAVLAAGAVVAVSVWAMLRPAPAVSGPQAGGTSVASTPPPPPPPTCRPAGTRLVEVASGTAYGSPCLAAPSDQPFTIVFQNRDPGTQHDVHIFSADPAADPSARSLFTGSLVAGPATVTYRVPALPAGVYFFHCDVHPTQMRGTLVVGG